MRLRARQRRQSFLGVDAGSREIRLALLEKVGGETVRVRALLSRPVGDGVEYGTPEYAGQLRAALDAVVAGSRRTLFLVGLLHPDRVRYHHLKIPAVATERLDDAVYWAVQREEGFTAGKVLLDFVREGVVEEDGEKRERITALLVERADVESQEKLYRSIGHPLSALVPPVRAGQALAEWEKTEEDPLIVAHVGDGTTRIHVVETGIPVLSRSIPLGMEQLVNPESGESDAEEVALPGVLSRMARQLERTVEYYLSSSGWFGGVPRIRLSGALAGNPGQVRELGDALTVPLTVVDPFAGLEAEPEDLPPPGERPLYGTACGLGLAGMLGGQNFLNTFRDRRLEEQSRWWSVVVLGIFVGLVALFGGWYAWELRALDKLEAEHAAISAEHAALPDGLSRDRMLGLLKESSGLREHLATRIARGEAGALMAELVAALPGTVRIFSISGRLAGGTGDGDSDAPEANTGRWLRLQGWCAGTEVEAGNALSILVERLEESPLVEAVELREMRPAGTVRQGNRFAMELSLPSPEKEGGES